MSNWEPTMRLRFVERLDQNPPAGAQVVRTVRTLQQQWRRLVSGVDEQGAYWDEKTEWRDVPLVKEGEE